MASKQNMEFFRENHDDRKPESFSDVTDSKEVDLSSKDDSLNIYNIISNEAALISEVPALIDRENIKWWLL